MSKQNSFFWSGLLATAIGVVGGLLLAPKSGKETRKNIAKLAVKISNAIKTESTITKKRVLSIFGQVNDEAMAKYKEVRDAVTAKVAAVKTTGSQLDKEKYGKLVEEVVDSFKTDLVSAKGNAKKISYYLKKDWLKVKKALT